MLPRPLRHGMEDDLVVISEFLRGVAQDGAFLPPKNRSFRVFVSLNACFGQQRL